MKRKLFIVESTTNPEQDFYSGISKIVGINSLDKGCSQTKDSHLVHKKQEWIM